MADRSRKVIGYFAFASPTEVVCTGDAGDACVISGSVRAMKAFLSEINLDGQKGHTVKKTRFGEILRGSISTNGHPSFPALHFIKLKCVFDNAGKYF